jgi:hypothetical protein
MQIKRDFAGSTDMWPTSAGGQLDRFYCTSGGLFVLLVLCLMILSVTNIYRVNGM